MPWWEWNVVWGAANVFLLKMSLEDVDYLRGVCGDLFGGGVPYGFKFGLVFDVGL